MNHQRFKFYKHSTEYYKSLYNTIKELEELDLTPSLSQYNSTINYNRKSKFIKSNSNTNKMHKKVGWVSWDSQSIITIRLMRLIRLMWYSPNIMLYSSWDAIINI